MHCVRAILLMIGTVLLTSSTAFAADSCRVLDKDLQGTYRGDCVDGYAQGIGEAAGRDSYVGGFSNGTLDGKGTYTWLDGSTLVGNFVSGRPHGHGVHVFGPRSVAPGARYEGDFANGKMEGNGIFYWPNGVRYEGQFKNNKAHGSGVLITPDGKKSFAEFANGRPVRGLPPVCPGKPTLIEC